MLCRRRSVHSLHPIDGARTRCTGASPSSRRSPSRRRRQHQVCAGGTDPGRRPRSPPRAGCRAGIASNWPAKAFAQRGDGSRPGSRSSSRPGGRHEHAPCSGALDSLPISARRPAARSGPVGCASQGWRSRAIMRPPSRRELGLRPSARTPQARRFPGRRSAPGLPQDVARLVRRVPAPRRGYAKALRKIVAQARPAARRPRGSRSASQAMCGWGPPRPG